MNQINEKEQASRSALFRLRPDFPPFVVSLAIREVERQNDRHLIHDWSGNHTKADPMTIRKFIKAIDWRAINGRAARAFGLLLMMLLWWMTPVITLALPERVECGMECCVSIGHCCCATRFQRPDADGGNHESHQEASITRVKFTQSCPPNCATLSSAPQIVSTFIHHPPATGLSEAEASPPFETDFSHDHNSPAADPSSPRAPPATRQVSVPKQ
jgi:hypothetical protein